jgi:putative peptidoglycan lipid II flippase
MVRKDLEGFRDTFSGAVRSLILIVLPATAGLLVLSRPIVRILFETGKFNAYSTSITSSALFYYAFGLLSCCMIKILVNAFYAMQDTRTPVKTMLFSVAINIVLSFLFMRHLKIGGLALASTLSATANMFFLYQVLKKRVGYLDEKRILASFVRILAASACMAIFVLGFDKFVLQPQEHVSRALQGLMLGGGIVLGIALYAGACLLFKVEEARKLFFK